MIEGHIDRPIGVYTREEAGDYKGGKSVQEIEDKKQEPEANEQEAGRCHK